MYESFVYAVNIICHVLYLILSLDLQVRGNLAKKSSPVIKIPLSFFPIGNLQKLSFPLGEKNEILAIPTGFFSCIKQ